MHVVCDCMQDGTETRISLKFDSWILYLVQLRLKEHELHIKTRSTEGAVRGPQYGPFPSIQPEKRSFEGCIEGFGPY